MLLTFVPSLLLSVWASTLSPSQIEVLQTQAVLQFHSKKYSASESTLNKILSADAANSNALELMALNYKARGDIENATEVYEKLLRKGETARLPSYHFELAMIRYKQKKMRDAIIHFEAAAEGKFNPGTSNFFLGVINFNRKFWEEARYNFSASLTYTDGKPMARISRYYLASAHAQLGKTDAAIVNYNEAQKEEKDSFSNDGGTDGFNALTKNIRENAIRELKSLDKGQRFINLSLLSQFDSNVQTNPSEVNNPVASSSQRTAKMVIAAAGGYSTSPVKNFQITPTYRFYTNYNFHYLATDYNFITHSPGLYVMYRPVDRLSYGFKAEGTYSMKNNLDVTDSRRSLHYKSYSLVGDVGPVVKFEATPQILMGAQLTWHPQKFFTDPSSGVNVRTGDGLLLIISSEFLTPFWWFNPVPSISFQWDNADGNNYKSYVFGFSLSNPVKISDRWIITPGFDASNSDFFETKSPDIRRDTNIALRASATYVINSRWTGTGDISWIHNDSTIMTSYTYNRVVVTGGATYAF